MIDISKLFLEFTIILALKSAKKKDQLNDIQLYIDANFLNRKIIEIINNNLPLLHDIIDKLGDFQWILVSYH
jgi:hypothetical protein